MPAGSVVVAPTAHHVSHGAHQPKDDAHDQDNHAYRPQESCAQNESNQHENCPKYDHDLTPLLVSLHGVVHLVIVGLLDSTEWR